jgi:hypothetical protein
VNEVIQEGEAQTSLFKDVEIRREFHGNEWLFSVVDVIAAITDSARARKYWSDLKGKLEDEGFELSEKIGQLKMMSPDGKMRDTDVANTETLFRIIQSVPSPRAERFKRWLAKVAYERIQEFQDPEIAIKRAILDYQIQGRSNDWIEARLRTIVSRKELTSEWKKRGVEEGVEYAKLTNTISVRTFDLGVKDHMAVKALKPSHNLRDHMTDLELIFTMLGEKSTAELARAYNARGFDENHVAAEAGGKVAGDARRNLEKELGRKVVSPSNFLTDRQREADPQRLSTPRR